MLLPLSKEAGRAVRTVPESGQQLGVLLQPSHQAGLSAQITHEADLVVFPSLFRCPVIEKLLDFVGAGEFAPVGGGDGLFQRFDLRRAPGEVISQCHSPHWLGGVRWGLGLAAHWDVLGGILQQASTARLRCSVYPLAYAASRTNITIVITTWSLRCMP